VKGDVGVDEASAHLLLLRVARHLRADDAAAERSARRLRLALGRGRLLAIFVEVRSKRGRNRATADLGMLHRVLHKNRQVGGTTI
jgi:hypothetical protein